MQTSLTNLSRQFGQKMFAQYGNKYAQLYVLASQLQNYTNSLKIFSGLLQCPDISETSLLRRLQAKTLPDEAPPMG